MSNLVYALGYGTQRCGKFLSREQFDTKIRFWKHFPKKNTQLTRTGFLLFVSNCVFCLGATVKLFNLLDILKDLHLII